MAVIASEQLDELFAYKNQLLEDLLTNETIVKLINDCASLENSDSLVYTQVFPHEFIPETVVNDNTLIYCDVDIQKVMDETFLMPVLYIWVFCHKSTLRLPTGGVRTDKLCAEITQAINGSRRYGFGKLNLYSVKRCSLMTDFHGRVLTFYAKDYNRLRSCPTPIPSNRREG